MGYLRDLRRRRLLARHRLADELWSRLLEEHPVLDGMDPDAMSRLRDLATLFLHEKHYEVAPAAGVTDYGRAVIATQACLPILELGMDWYSPWRTVVVVPMQFTGDFQEVDEAGVVHEWVEEMGGESWDHGPLVVSWEDVEASGWGEGYSVVIHEAAHKLDLSDGEMNGRPALHEDMDPERWTAVMTEALEDLRRRGTKWRRGRVDPYGAESAIELFAVTSETFFEEPRVLARQYPGVYAELRAFYRQDPATRSRRAR